MFLPVVLRWQLQARRQRRQDFRQTEAAGGVRADWYAARRASAGTAAFPTFISNGISGGFFAMELPIP